MKQGALAAASVWEGLRAADYSDLGLNFRNLRRADPIVPQQIYRYIYIFFRLYFLFKKNMLAKKSLYKKGTNLNLLVICKGFKKQVMREQ